MAGVFQLDQTLQQLKLVHLIDLKELYRNGMEGSFINVDRLTPNHPSNRMHRL